MMMQNDVTISLKAAEEAIFEVARTYGGPLPNGLVNSITLALSKLPTADAAKDAEIAALQASIDDCAPYLKQGQTPVERMQQDHADILHLMESLKRAKERAAMWPKHLLDLIERAREYVQDNLEGHEHSDGRTLLNGIDEALKPDAQYCFTKTKEAQ